VTPNVRCTDSSEHLDLVHARKWSSIHLSQVHSISLEPNNESVMGKYFRST
jgi:hypothetical protein